MPTPEQQARQTIDAMLAAPGWVVQSLDELNLSAARGVAVREMQSMGGPADYILFVDGRALGVVEAKKAGTTLSGVAEQSARYTHARRWIPQRWADPLPFTYESTGIETHFRDAALPLLPLAKQLQIVAEVEARTTAIDHLEAELDRQITRSNRLRHSVLACLSRVCPFMHVSTVSKAWSS